MRKSTKYLAAVAAIAIGSASPFMVAAQTMQKSPVRLADVMSAVQFRHSKLWTAGQQKNWELAGYELELVKSSLNEAIALYTDIPGRQYQDDRSADQIDRERDRHSK